MFQFLQLSPLPLGAKKLNAQERKHLETDVKRLEQLHKILTTQKNWNLLTRAK